MTKLTAPPLNPFERALAAEVPGLHLAWFENSHTFSIEWRLQYQHSEQGSVAQEELAHGDVMPHELGAAIRRIQDKIAWDIGLTKRIDEGKADERERIGKILDLLARQAREVAARAIAPNVDREQKAVAAALESAAVEVRRG